MSKQISPALDQAKTALSNIQSMVQDLLAQRSALQEKRQVIFDERESLLLQPLSKAEVLQAICEVIDLRAEDHAAKLNRIDLFDLIAFPSERQHAGFPNPSRHEFPLTICDLDRIKGEENPYARDLKKTKPWPAIKDFGWHLPILPRHGEFEPTWLHFFFGDLIKQKLCAFLADGEEGVLLENGQPNAQSLKDRSEKIDDLSQELVEIDTAIDALGQDIKSLTAPVIRSANALNEQ